MLVEWADKGNKAAIRNISCMFKKTNHVENRNRRYKEELNGTSKDEKCNIWNENILQGINSKLNNAGEKIGEPEGTTVETILMKHSEKKN